MNWIKVAIGFFLFVFLQKIIFQSPLIVFNEAAVPKVFVVYLLMLPYDISLSLVFLIAFGMGLVLDFLIFPIGAHAFTSLLIVVFRNLWVKLITPQIIINPTEQIEPQKQNFRWQVLYVLPLVLIYELVYNVLADFTISFFTLEKVFFSWLYTSFFCLIFTILFFRKVEV
jgi:hypothetical protein